jgi:hypothetical protein
MYSVNDSSMGDYPPVSWISQGTLPKVPLDLSMVLPRGDVMERQFPTPSPDGEAVVASLGDTSARASSRTGAGVTAGNQSVNWAQWGQDMLTTGIDDTKNILASLIGGSGKKSVQQGFDTTFQQQLAQQQTQMQMQQQTAAIQQQMALERQKMQMQLELAKAQAQAATPPTVPGVPLDQQQQQVYPMIGPSIEPKVEKKFPTWAWVLIGLGGAAAVGGVLYFTLGRKKTE